jgi:hypothetical protein
MELKLPPLSLTWYVQLTKRKDFIVADQDRPLLQGSGFSFFVKCVFETASSAATIYADSMQKTGPKRSESCNRVAAAQFSATCHYLASHNESQNKAVWIWYMTILQEQTLSLLHWCK